MLRTGSFLWPSLDQYSPRSPLTLEIGEIENYDFLESAEQIFRILSVLKLSNLIDKMPYKSSFEVLGVIQRLIDGLDLGRDELQVNELGYIRAEFRDELLSIEMYIGV